MTTVPADPHVHSPDETYEEVAARRIAERLELLAADSEEPGRLTRPFLAPSMLRAMDRIEGWMKEACLEVRRDGFGNLIGRREGSGPDTLLIGSHLDTVPNAGRFDGQLGVLVGIEIAARMATTLCVPAISFEFVAFSEEEGVRFAFPFIGSKGFFGAMTDADLARRDSAGVSIGEALRQAGYDARTPGRGPWRYIGYHEVHLEQGPVLEGISAPIGIVRGIAGQVRLSVTVNGLAGHAGTTPMNMRRDALVAASRMIGAVRGAGRSTKGLVATVGRIESSPNAINVIPDRVEFSIDIRHLDAAVLEEALSALKVRLAELAKEEGTTVTVRELSRQAPAPCDPDLIAAQAAAHPLAPILTSGAGHDGLALHEHLPISMSFVRCRGGISHHPDEFVATEDIAVALDATQRFINVLASRNQSTGVTT
ncbi:hydantoinase/carbamoylase family amidase [bacterium]|nr:hydantoinase/carbamoylase family amidase [bacterium]